MHELLSKRNFPIFSEYPSLVYLDSAATTQKPKQVTDAVLQYYRAENANPMRGLYALSMRATEVCEQAREAVRAFIGAASTQEIIFTRNATESLNLAAYSWGRANLHPGDEILVAVSEHHSNLLPWQQLARQTGASLCWLECDQEGVYSMDALRAALHPQTKVFAFAQVSNVTGQCFPVKEAAALCRANGTVTVCDGAQSVPHMPVDVQALGVDFLAFSGHKMLAPMGIGVLYGRKALLEAMPPFLYGGEMIESVTREGAVFAELPHKFEAGTVNAGGAAGLLAAVQYYAALGFSEITAREDALTVQAVTEMQQIPHVRVIGAQDPAAHHGIVSFTVDGVHPHDLAAIFDADGIAVRAGHHCAQPLHRHLGVPSTARMSLAFYNDEADLARFLSTLKTVRRRMGFE